MYSRDRELVEKIVLRGMERQVFWFPAPAKASVAGLSDRDSVWVEYTLPLAYHPTERAVPDAMLTVFYRKTPPAINAIFVKDMFA